MTAVVFNLVSFNCWLLTADLFEKSTFLRFLSVWQQINLDCGEYIHMVSPLHTVMIDLACESTVPGTDSLSVVIHISVTFDIGSKSFVPLLLVQFSEAYHHGMSILSVWGTDVQSLPMFKSHQDNGVSPKLCKDVHGLSDFLDVWTNLSVCPCRSDATNLISQLVQIAQQSLCNREQTGEGTISDIRLIWQVTSTDLFKINRSNYMYLVVTEYFSRCPEAIQWTSTTSTSDVSALKVSILESIVICNNGPQYWPLEFRTCANSYAFHHLASSPRFPQINGHQCDVTLHSLHFLFPNDQSESFAVSPTYMFQWRRKLLTLGAHALEGLR